MIRAPVSIASRSRRDVPSIFLTSPAVELCNRFLQLSVEHQPIRDDNGRVEHDGIRRVMRGNQPVHRPGDGV